MVVQNFGTSRDVMIRLPVQKGVTSAQQSEQVLAALKSEDAGVTLRRTEFVGPQVGEELVHGGLMALGMVVLGIVIYLAFRFEWKFGVAAIIANLHDVVIILGFFAFFQWEFSLSVLAGVLAVLGYSVNESVVIFDRIREAFRRFRKLSTHEVIDHAITSTMSRTIITHASTEAMVLSMFFFGGPSLHYFALALTIGILFGIYSSVFVAAAIAMWLGVKREDLVKTSARKEGDPNDPNSGRRGLSTDRLRHATHIRAGAAQLISRVYGHPPSSTPADRRLAQQARQRFVDSLCDGLPALDKKLYEFLTDLMAQTATQRDMQLRRDAWMNYQAHRKAWVEDVARAWREGLLPQQSASATMPLDGGLELVDDNAVENRLLASRMALTVTEHVGAAYEVARQRTQHLDGREISSRDILRPETLCQRLVEAWLDAGLKRDDLQLVLDPAAAPALGELALAQYQALLKLYDEQGVVTAEELRTRVRRPGGAGSSRSAPWARQRRRAPGARDTVPRHHAGHAAAACSCPVACRCPWRACARGWRVLPRRWPMRASVPRA